MTPCTYIIKPHADGSTHYLNRATGKGAWLHKGLSWWCIQDGSTGLDAFASCHATRADAIEEIERVTRRH